MRASYGGSLRQWLKEQFIEEIVGFGYLRVFARRGVDIKRYPAIHKHLTLSKDPVVPKPKNWAGDTSKGRKPDS